MSKKRLIAMYLPQYHPFKENDEWWGKGFTEWRNVAKARPRFRGHYQPHIPSDLGFYDLRLPEVRLAQASLAQKYGIDGFCYYHYWFNGHMLMDRPLNEVLSSGEPDFPFMLCWANENWTKAWDGGENHVLIQQNYSIEDDIEHINYLIKNVFCDKRYIRIDNKPVFCIYRSELFPNMKETINIWRQEALHYGMSLYICRMESFGNYGKSYLDDGFDAAVEFQPSKNFNTRKGGMIPRIFNKVLKILGRNSSLPIIIDYKKYVETICQSEFPSYKRYPCVTPMWDNSPRRVNSAFFALKNSTPVLYKKWLSFVLNKFKPYSDDENLVFINAWNEWAEGNHLEPDLKWGTRYLSATLEAKKQNE